MAYQIISLTIVYSTVYSGVDQRKNQSSASPAFARGIHLRPVNSPHECPVTRKMFLFDDVIIIRRFYCRLISTPILISRYLYIESYNVTDTILDKSIIWITKKTPSKTTTKQITSNRYLYHWEILYTDRGMICYTDPSDYCPSTKAIISLAQHIWHNSEEYG